MTGSTVTPTTTLSDKLALVTHHHLLTRVPVKLDFEEWNYGSWEYFFDQLCESYEVSKFIHGESNGTSTSLPSPFTPEDLKVDKIILSWIFTTLSDALQKRLVIARPKTAKEAWSFLSDLVKDHKKSRTSALKTELRTIKLGDLSMEAYFQKVESLMTTLASLNSPVSEDDVVHYVIDGLPEMYNQVCGYMHYQDTFPDFKTVRSLLTTEEMRLKSKSLATPVDSSSSSPMVLLADSGTSRRPSNPQIKSWRPCFNFAKGTCRFGSECRYVHDENAKHVASTPKQLTNSTDTLLLKLLEKLGVHESGTSRETNNHPKHSNPVAYTANANSIPFYYSAQQVHPHVMAQPAQYVAPPPGFTYPPAHQQILHQPAHPLVPANPTAGPILTHQPAQTPTIPFQQVHGLTNAGSVQQAQPGFVTGSTESTGQATTLPQAFTTGTLHDPNTGTWNMDTGASSHLNNSVTSLSTIFNSSMYPSVSVGDGHSIPVTNSGHSILPTTSKSLHLLNVLITPHIVKNLVSVRQFVRDNNCTIEFDSFGFSVKDFLTRRVLLRCDSTGDLYPVTAPSPIPHAFLVSQHTWHQRLGHPGSEVLRRLVSSNSISCNKEKSPVLCHACQLGKHVRLPFVSSNTVVSSCFDIIHSDVWTSPIPSLSGFKYYVLFLDHYSQFVWVYPLLNKSDVLSKFVLFRKFVHTQFNCEIKSFQCDHGGEFDNRALHKLFADNGIQFRFSCAHTSQQNGKSERMIRTINNLIRTLLFQANLPPTFWVEALNMAVYLTLIIFTITIVNDVPYTRLFGSNPDYNLLRTFGCLCYPHVYTTHKLEPRATPSIFLGHASNHRGYRCYNLHTKQIIISRHVTFDETVFPYGTAPPAMSNKYTFLDDYLEPSTIPIVSPHNHTSSTLTTMAQQAPLPTTPQHNTTSQPNHFSHTAQQSPNPTDITPTTHSSSAQSSATQPVTSAQHNSRHPSTANSTSTIIPDPPTNPNPVSTHSMVTRYRVGSNHPPDRLTLHVSSISPLPKSYRDAFNDPNWQNAMCDEYNALIKNNTWTLVPRPTDTNVVRCMWLFRHKYHADGTLSRYKARLVANGSTQIEGIDVDETFSPVVKPGTIRTVLSLATSRHWPIHQLDVKNAFLHGDLSETVYMHQPPGFRDSEHPDYVCLLQRSLYGLKQAPRAWFQRFASYITRSGFSHSRCDSSLFIYRQGTNTAYLLLYVDDIVLTASSEHLLQQIIHSLHQEFSMTDLGSLNYFLGISVTRNSSGMFLSQRKYATEILERAHMVGCNSSRTPVDTESKLGDGGAPVSDPTLYRSLAGSLQYLTFTRPDISYAVQQVCLYMHDPREPHFSALKRILRYVSGTLDYGLQLFSSTTTELVAYSDADWVGCPTTRRSTSGYCVFLGNNLLSWSSKRQPTLSRSSAEAEYRGVANVVAETCWLRNLLRELHSPLSSATLVYCDNVSAVYLSCNLVQHQRTKHIEIDIHFVRDLVATGQVRVLHVPSRYQFADIFTKGLPSTLFEEFRSSLSVRCPPAPTAGEC
ncbi:ribonuclease H-like domain-containing protein [Tanacetum coccineum]